jgi:hypothetical protein
MAKAAKKDKTNLKFLCPFLLFLSFGVLGGLGG